MHRLLSLAVMPRASIAEMPRPMAAARVSDDSAVLNAAHVAVGKQRWEEAEWLARAPSRS